MLQTGSLGLDPFSRRRLESALGGQSFLHTFVLCILPEESLRIIDPGIGFIVSLGLIFGYLNKQGIAHNKCFLALFPFLLSVPEFRNTTSIFIALCLFLSLFRTLHSNEIRKHHLINRAFIISLLVAAIFASKNTFIPVAFIMVMLNYTIDFFSSRFSKKALLELAAIALLTFLLIVPWMISLYQSSGTFLYPFLGKGYHASAYYDYYTHRTSDLLSFKGFKDIAKASLHVSHICLLILTVVYIFSRTWRKEYLQEQKTILSLIFATWLGVLLYLLLAGVVAPRYTYPFVYAAIAVLWTEIAFATNKRQESRLNWSFIVAVAAILLLVGNGGGLSESIAYYKAQLQSARQALTMTHLLADEQEAQRYVEMQSSIPPAALLLARLEKPFLLDFSRNQIFIVDSPGHGSLPPGMPLFKGSEALAKYLTNRGIRYVAYSYKREPGAQRAYWIKKLGSEIYPWVEPNRIIQVLRPSLRSEIQYTLDFQENLRLLGHSRKRIFDNGEIFVLDLLQPLRH